MRQKLTARCSTLNFVNAQISTKRRQGIRGDTLLEGATLLQDTLFIHIMWSFRDAPFCRSVITMFGEWKGQRDLCFESYQLPHVMSLNQTSKSFIHPQWRSSGELGYGLISALYTPTSHTFNMLPLSYQLSLIGLLGPGCK
jgi:hypothetical protein